MVKTINFSHLYLKLGNKLYTTLRKDSSNQRKKYEIGDIVEVKYKGTILHHAKLLNKTFHKLDYLPESLLIMDTSYKSFETIIIHKNREQCYNLIQSFYKNQIFFSKQIFIMYLLKKTRLEN